MTDLFGGKILRTLRDLRGGVHAGSLALAVSCATAFLPSFAAIADTYTWTGGASGILTDASNWMPALQGTFTAGDELVVNDAAEITLNAAATVGKITLNAAGATRFLAPGGAPFTIGSIENAGTGTVTFDCSVLFSGTYYVVQNGAVKFPGGATATYPDNGLREATASANTLVLDGNFTFTADWTVNDVGDYPWVIPSGTVVRGQRFTGTQTGQHRILRVEQGGEAYFTSVTNGLDKGDIDIDGYLEASEEAVLQTTTASSSSIYRFGRSGNTGTVKARRIVKTGHSIGSFFIPNLIVGAGGFGSIEQDYTLRLEVDTTITAADDFEVLAVYRSAGLHDWGLGCTSTVTLTFNVPEGKTVTYGTGFSGANCAIRKTGDGTLVMTDTFAGNSGFLKQYANGTFVDEGTVRIASSGKPGTGPVTVASGARLEIASGVAYSNQTDGEGTLALEDGVTLTMGNIPWSVGAVEVASGATVNVTTAATGTFAFLTGVNASDLASFKFGGNALTLAGDTLFYAGGSTVGAYVWNGADGADWSAPASWLVDGAAPATAPASSDTIIFQNASPVTVGGTGTLTVTKIVTLSDDLVTFGCPVQFAGTYLVENAATAPLFAGGVMATYPDASLTDMNLASHTLNGTFTFTADWTIPLQPAATPFVLSAGSTLTGTTLAATTYSNTQIDLRIDPGAVATFDTVEVGGKLVFWLNGGNLIVNGDVHLGGDATGRDFGYSVQPNTGMLEANGIYKNVTGVGLIYHYITNMVVGAGGFGMYRKDYTIRLERDTWLTAKDDCAIHQPIAADVPRDTDWGLNLYNHVFTVNTAGHTVNFDSWTAANDGSIVKEGAGEMTMQGCLKLHTGGTTVREGQMTVKRTGAQGNGPVTVEAGATLANTIVISHPYPLILKAGAILKPVQNMYFDVTGGTLTLPEEGTVTVDMTEFNLVNGVANPILAGVAAGDEAKFSALVTAGVSGSFSVSGGFLYYTPTAGGSAAADLFWHPAGDSTWSLAVPAWTNAAGEQVVFTPYANVTVADAATITLPNDVDANDVKVSADSDVALNGAGKLGGPGAIIKTGSGTFTFNATGGLDAQPIIVSNGVFRMGDDLTGTLGSTADSSPIVVTDGGTFDVNFNKVADNAARSRVTRDKLVRVAGAGADGRGAIVNVVSNSYYTFSDMVLDDDATMGGSRRFDVRGNMSGYVRNAGSIYGPDKTLTVLNPAFFGIVNASVDLKAIVVTNGGALRVEGTTANWNLTDGIRLRGGTLSAYGNVVESSFPIVVDSGENKIENGTGTATINSPITVAAGAKLTQTAGNILYKGTVNGTLHASGGYTYIDGGAPANGWTVNGAMGSERIYLRQSGTYTGADITSAVVGIADASNMTVNATFLDSTLNIRELYLGWGNAFVNGGNLTLGSGTTLTTSKIAIGYSATNKRVSDVMSSVCVDGGMIHHTGTSFFVSYSSPHAEFVLNAGTVTVDTAAIQIHGNTATNYSHLGGYSASTFRQNGGTFNYGGAGFTSSEFEDNTEDGFLVFKGGEFNASANWSIPHYIPLCFKEGGAGWTLNQADNTTATWTTALHGNGDVNLNGAATLVGNKEVQGAVGGKWTVGDGFTAGLEGAASLLGGLELGEGATATVNIATNRSAVFTARDGSDEFGQAGCITSRFNRVLGGTTRGTITHDESFLLAKPSAANRPFGNRNYQAAYAVGQFYVEPEKAGTWYFKGYCDDYILLVIDGETVLSSVGGTKCATRYGTNELAAGWHTFRQIATDVGGDFGGAPTMGYNTNGSSTYTPFSVKTLKMRPAANDGVSDHANTVRWSHFKQTTDTSSWKDTDKYKVNDLAWDFCCITNNLQMLQWYGKNDTVYFNTHTVNRFDGWFLVTEENADKEWTFRNNYDDNCALWIDGVDTGLTGASGNTLTYKVTLARGWHRFEIRTYDNTGNAGPWSGNGYAVSYQVAGGAQTLFSEQTLQLSVCPDGYVQGGVTLASGATLSNGASENAAVIYGDVTATGTGAAISGPFQFEGGTIAFENVSPDTRNLSSVLAFENPADNFLANVKEITVDFTSQPTCTRIAVCPLGGMTSLEAEAKVTATVNGVPYDKCRIQIDGNTVYLNRGGTVIFVR